MKVNWQVDMRIGGITIQDVFHLRLLEVLLPIAL